MAKIRAFWGYQVFWLNLYISTKSLRLFQEFEFMKGFEPVNTFCKMNQIVQTFSCTDCRLKFVCETTFKLHNKVDEEDDIDDTDIQFGSKHADQSERYWEAINNKKVSNGNSKLVRSLREDELEGINVFNENIEIRENYLFC